MARPRSTYTAAFKPRAVKMSTDQQLSVAEAGRPLEVGENLLQECRKMFPSVLARAFEPPEPNEAWSADITSIPTKQGWLYLAVVEDLFSRRIVGRSMADGMGSRGSWTPWGWPSPTPRSSG